MVKWNKREYQWPHPTAHSEKDENRGDKPQACEGNRKLLNEWPRKRLGYKTPNNVFAEAKTGFI